jgi:hypothetical protein
LRNVKGVALSHESIMVRILYPFILIIWNWCAVSNLDKRKMVAKYKKLEKTDFSITFKIKPNSLLLFNSEWLIYAFIYFQK